MTSATTATTRRDTATPTRAATPSPSTSTATAPQTVRVAVYTRKSTDDGLDQEFNSLHAQRGAVEAYVESQRGLRWVALPEHYDDGGFSGATTTRPAFQRLLRDVEAGRVDVVAVYKIDRLSRSLLDFTQLMQFFERHGATFLSVTQQFSTATSVGRMTLNLLATFAQFERETISERTRDKMAASRRRGLWVGGRPVLGYDVVDKKLVVNEPEAAQVREVFALFQERSSLIGVVDELRRRGVSNKTFLNKRGERVEGRPFTKATLRYLLENPLYVGEIPLRDERFRGVHEPIVDRATFDAVQARIAVPGPRLAVRPRGRWDVMLQGLLRCAVCGAAMTHHYCSRGARRWSYYVCTTAQKQGAAACPRGRVALATLEEVVVAQLRGRSSEEATSQRAAVGECVVAADATQDDLVDAAKARVAATWDGLTFQARAELVALLVEEVVYDGRDGGVELQLRLEAVRTLAVGRSEARAR